MITKDNLAALLLHPNFDFTKRGNIYKKEYSQGASIEVNTDTQKITYSPVDSLFIEGEFPTKDKPANGFVIHRDTTLNFSANENFVCFPSFLNPSSPSLFHLFNFSLFHL